MIKKAGKDAWNVVKRGNMFMLAIGLLLGTSFNAVVSSLANHVIMAAIAKVLNTGGLEQWEVNGIFIGKFLAALISFLIVAIIIFIALWTTFIIIEVIRKNKEKFFKKTSQESKQIEETQTVKEPTTEELILEELKNLNNNITNLKNSK
ncbi:MscL family protein [Mycoplasma sp. 744]|uniref:large conductance mechanosensitive channel protein MscL n=1 Tax=unclassified Mycoplasma TaxID=2683645 RepID=UPI00211C7BAA|nr:MULTISPECIES: MscL family protein [unclassified Mycoplasma]MEA4115278.1 MscL family protein [Mycoplasma sp. 744]UUM19281.1 MscL family protein [Mycoplasma sp. 1018B]